MQWARLGIYPGYKSFQASKAVGRRTESSEWGRNVPKNEEISTVDFCAWKSDAPILVAKEEFQKKQAQLTTTVFTWQQQSTSRYTTAETQLPKIQTTGISKTSKRYLVSGILTSTGRTILASAQCANSPLSLHPTRYPKTVAADPESSNQVSHFSNASSRDVSCVYRRQ